MKAWLITRGAAEVAALKGYEIVDILSARKSDEDVRQYVQRLHDLSCLTLSERAEQARYNRKKIAKYIGPSCTITRCPVRRKSVGSFRRLISLAVLKFSAATAPAFSLLS